MTTQFRAAIAKHVVTLAVAGLGLVLTPGTARADFLDFLVDETAVAVGSGIFVADKINGAYTERITIDGAGNFAVSAYADFGLYLANEGTTPIPGTGGIGGTDLNTTYGMYATLTAVGTVTPIVPGIIFGFTASDADATLFLDPDLDTTKDVPADGGDPVILGNNADDFDILNATTLGPPGPSGFHGILVVGTGGFFDFIFVDPTLTPEGQLYWPDLPLFGITAVVDGDFDSFAASGSQVVTGDVSVVFQSVPEPAMLSLLGMGLLGAGLAARRRRQAAR
jgi:hypothetical protein